MQSKKKARNILTGSMPWSARSVTDWLRVLALLTAVAFGAGVVLFGYFAFSLPALDRLERFEPGLITRVEGKGGALVHEFYLERRIWTPEKEIPEILKQAVIAVEDRSFYRHWGIDLSAYPSALLPVVLGDRARGASTLTQQLAKNLFLTPERSIARKAREVLLAVRIERNYTKQEILEFYFNQVYLGSGVYGFASAADRYFSKPLDSLAAAQHAMLAGLLQRPEAYRPDHSPEAARARRDVVLGAMLETGALSRPEWEAAVESPLGTRIHHAPSNLGPYFIEHVRQFAGAQWGDPFLYTQGGRIAVTMDSALQHTADSALEARLEGIRARQKRRTAVAYDMSRHLGVPLEGILRDWERHYDRFEKDFLRPDARNGTERFPSVFRYRPAQAALIVIENETGAVRALVGGADFEISKYNRALQAVRSPGSAFKPFVYAAAVEQGAGPGDIVNDQPISIPEVSDTGHIWQPTNFEPGFEGRMTMRRALYRSKNLPAVETGLKYGIDNVVSLARRCGFRRRVPAVPSLSLGACDATLLELVSAYTIFPNGGARPEPYFVESVHDREGSELYRHTPRRDEALSPAVAWILTSMLQDVNVRGTAASVRASGFRHPSGGKTGTTNDYTDAWYVGFTRDYTAGVWVGVDDYSRMGPGNTGSINALPIWIDVMRSAMNDRPRRGFPRPEGVVEVSLCSITGLRAQSFCPAHLDYHVAGDEPVAYCSPGYHTRSPALTGEGRSPVPEPEPVPAPPPSAPRDDDPRIRTTF